MQQCWTLLFPPPIAVLPFSFSEHCLNQLEGTISGILQPIVEAIIAAIIGNSWTTGRCHCLIFVLKYIDSYFGDYLRSLRVDGDKELNWTFKITIKTLIIAFKFLFLDPLPPSGSNQSSFLDALAPLDFKLWVSQLLTFLQLAHLRVFQIIVYRTTFVLTSELEASLILVNDQLCS